MQRPGIFIVALLAGLLLPASVQAATLTLHFTNNGEPLEDPLHGKFYLYEPEQRESYITWGHAARAASVPDGVYDLIIVYHNDTIREERVYEEIELEGDMEQEVAFAIPVARLTVHVTSGGKPVELGTARFQIHRAGQRGKPLASRRPGATVTMRPGTYDIEVAYRDLEGLQARWLEGYYVEDVREETVEMSSTAARLEVTVTSGGRPLPASAARWVVFPAGRREDPLQERRSGDSVVLDAGRYDVAVYFNFEGARGQRWLDGVEVQGYVRRQIDIAEETSDLRVHIRRRGRSLTGAWFTIFRAGDRSNALLSGSTGATVQIEPGTYDIRSTLRRGGLRVEQWVEGQRIEGSTELSVEMMYVWASLRVQPKERGASSDAGEPGSVLLLVDSSAAMASELGVRSRMEHVTSVVPDAVDYLEGNRVELGLRAYGILPRSRQDCRDTTLLVPLRRPDRRAISRALSSLRPSGKSPIAYSLEAAGGELQTNGESTIVLITGSPDDCAGDPCAAATQLLRSGAATRIYVLGLGIGYNESTALDCIGDYHTVTSAVELKSALRGIFRAVRRGEAGAVNVFEPDGGRWVASAFLRERLELNPGTYDIQIISDGETYLWEKVKISGTVEVEAAPRPPRRLR
jgi:hypothetical protein